MTESMNPTVETWEGTQRAATSAFQGTGLPAAGLSGLCAGQLRGGVVRERGTALRRLAGDHRYGPVGSSSPIGGGAQARFERLVQNSIAQPVSGLLPVSRQVLTS